MTRPAERGRDGELHRPRLGTIEPMPLVWLAVVWMALWRDFSVANALVGLTVAAVVMLVFPLPALRAGVRLRPLHLAWLVIRFLYDVVVASVEVAALTLQFGRQPRSAVVAVELRTPSDLVTTMVSQMTSLVPGTLVVEAHRHTRTVYVHALDVDGKGDEVRQQVLAQERRIALALGIESEVAR